MKSTKTFNISLDNINLSLIETWVTKEFGNPGTQWGKKWFHRTIIKPKLRVRCLNNQMITNQLYVPCRVFYFRDPAHATMFYLKWSNEKME